MYLTPISVLPYLVDRGLLAIDELVEGGVAVAQHPDRSVLVVRREGASGFVVKQPSPLLSRQLMRLDREATIYELARSRAGASEFGRLLPDLVAYDTGVHALVIERLTDAETLDAFHANGRPGMDDVAGRVGAAVALCHTTFAPVDGWPPSALFPHQPPWVLSIHGGEFDDELGAAARAVVDVVRDEPAFHAPLDRLREEWRSDCLIHGDMRWSNVLVGAPDRPGRVWVVDWEGADVGDPAWDLAAVVQSYLAHRLTSRHGRGSAADADAAGWWESARESIRVLWLSYVAARGLDDGPALALRERVVGFVGARLVQTAFEMMRPAERLAPVAVTLLQVSQNVFADPDAAAADLLGLA